MRPTQARPPKLSRGGSGVTCAMASAKRSETSLATDPVPLLLLFVALAVFLGGSSLVFALDLDPMWSRQVFWASVAAALGLALVRCSRASVALTVAVLVAGLAIGSFAYDVSYDGPHYHLPASLELANGLNLFREPGTLIWTNIYPSGAWRINAALYNSLPLIDPAVVVNLAASVLSGLLLLRLWQRSGYGLGLLEAVLILGVAFSPVVIAQMLSAMQDGLIASLFLCLAFLLAEETLPDGGAALSSRLGAVAIALLLASTKTSGIAFLVAAFGIAGLYALIYARAAFKPLFVMGLVATLASAGVNYQPLAGNMQKYGSPVAPSSEVIANQFPDDLAEAGHLKKLAAGVFARTGGSVCCAEPVEFKVPGTFTILEIRSADSGPRTGGFGPLFGALLLLCIALEVAWRPWAIEAVPHRLAAIGLGTIALYAVFPEPWNARYVPMLAPGVLLLALGAVPRAPRLVLWLVAGVATANTTAFALNAASAGYGRIKDVYDFRQAVPAGSRVLLREETGKFDYPSYLELVLRRNGYVPGADSCERTAVLLSDEVCVELAKPGGR